MSGYTGVLVTWALAVLQLIVTVVKRSDDVKGFVVLPRRWVVERTFAWLGNFRRLLVRHERHLSTFRAFFVIAFRMGTSILADVPVISEVRLEANNRTWDTIAERGDDLGVYTDARPPYGCLGLTLRREDL